MTTRDDSFKDCGVSRSQRERSQTRISLLPQKINGKNADSQIQRRSLKFVCNNGTSIVEKKECRRKKEELRFSVSKCGPIEKSSRRNTWRHFCNDDQPSTLKLRQHSCLTSDNEQGGVF